MPVALTDEQLKGNVQHDYINHEGMSLESIQDIDLRVRKYVHDYVPFWKKLCETTAFKKGRDEYVYRVTVRPDVNLSDWTPLREGEGTTSTSIRLASFKFGYKNYGKHMKYTKESVDQNLDDTRVMAIDNFSLYAEEVPEAIIADTLTKSSFSLTAKTTVTDTLDLVKNIHAAKKARKIPAIGGEYWPVILSTPLLTKLKRELRSQGEVLNEATKSDITVKGEVYTYDGFAFIVRDDDCMFEKDTQGAITTYKMFFPTLTREGLMPGNRIPESISIFDNGLGHGLVRNPVTGAYEEDTNKRVGSLGINIDHLGVTLQQSLGMLMTTYAASAVEIGSTADNDTDELATAVETNVAPDTTKTVTEPAKAA